MAWIHRLSNIDSDKREADCANCGRVAIHPMGGGRSSWRCAVAHAERRGYSGGKSYKKHRKDSCERCGFVPEHPAQLDVHHRDRDRSNNDLSNLETICANCHRLEHVADHAR